jgi:alkylation response protein AidB-like acyl-CoA dehydrogenase
VDSDTSSERELLRDATARFLRKHGSIAFVREHGEGTVGFDADAWRMGAELGWTSLLVREADGGGSVTGEGLLDLMPIAEELGRVLHPSPFLGTNITALAISQFGSELLRAKTLPPILSGELAGAWCSSGVTPDDGVISATRTTEGLELSGTAGFVQDGPSAGLYLVTVANKFGEVTQCVVLADAAGVSREALVCLDLSREVAEVRFDAVAVPASAILGEFGKAGTDMARLLETALVLKCADSLGAFARVNEVTFEYAQDRFAFGRPIGSFQAIKHKCVDMYLAYIGAQSVTAAAAEAVQARSPDAASLAAMAKAYVDDSYARAVQHSHQIFGGISMTWEHDTHLYSRHARFNQATLGTAGWHRDRLAQMLGM